MLIFSDHTTTVVIPDADCSEQIPLGGALAGDVVRLGDGTQLFSTVGWTPADIHLTGTLRTRDRTGTPLGRAHALTDMAKRHQPVQFTWTGDGQRQTYTVQMTACHVTIIGHNDAAYDITLFRPSDSPLLSSASSAANPQTSRNAQQMRARAAAAGGRTVGEAQLLDGFLGLLGRH